MNNQIICSPIVQFGASWASWFSLLLEDEYVLVVLDEAYMLLSYGAKKIRSQNSINTSFICCNTDKYFNQFILSTSLRP